MADKDEDKIKGQQAGRVFQEISKRNSRANKQATGARRIERGKDEEEQKDNQPGAPLGPSPMKQIARCARHSLALTLYRSRSTGNAATARLTAQLHRGITWRKTASSLSKSCRM